MPSCKRSRSASPTASEITLRVLRNRFPRPIKTARPDSNGSAIILGIFDSGLGGLTVLSYVRARLPREDIVYLADQAHVPYGERSTDDLAQLMATNVAYLERAGVDAIVMGCNTSCAVAAQRGWPAARVPILDLITAAADDVAGAGAGARAVGILATSATARSGAYGNALRAREPELRVQECAAPELVPLVEAGLLEGAVTRAAVAAACAQFTAPFDTLVLACTHYPLLDAHFAAVCGPQVRRVDPAHAQAVRAARYVERRGGERGSALTTFATTGDLASYRAAVNVLSKTAPGETRRFVTAAAAFVRA